MAAGTKRESKGAKKSARTPAFCRMKREAYGGCRHTRRRIKHAGEGCTHDRPKVKQTWNQKTRSWERA